MMLTWEDRPWGRWEEYLGSPRIPVVDHKMSWSEGASL
jgi:hypothetical protein